jgi:hypothetical protein
MAGREVPTDDFSNPNNVLQGVIASSLVPATVGTGGPSPEALAAFVAMTGSFLKETARADDNPDQTTTSPMIEP